MKLMRQSSVVVCIDVFFCVTVPAYSMFCVVVMYSQGEAEHIAAKHDDL